MSKSRTTARAVTSEVEASMPDDSAVILPVDTAPEQAATSVAEDETVNATESAGETAATSDAVDIATALLESVGSGADLNPYVPPKPDVVVPEPDAPPTDEYEHLSAVGQGVMQDLLAYETVMNPSRPANAQNINNSQARLFNTLSFMFNSAPDFENTFEAVLDFVHASAANRGAFHADYLYRNWESLTGLTNQQQTCFGSILNLISRAADPQSRFQVFKQVSPTKALPAPITEDARQRMMQYFGM